MTSSSNVNGEGATTMISTTEQSKLDLTMVSSASSGEENGVETSAFESDAWL